MDAKLYETLDTRLKLLENLHEKLELKFTNFTKIQLEFTRLESRIDIALNKLQSTVNVLAQSVDDIKKTMTRITTTRYINITTAIITTILTVIITIILTYFLSFITKGLE